MLCTAIPRVSWEAHATDLGGRRSQEQHMAEQEGIAGGAKVATLPWSSPWA